MLIGKIVDWLLDQQPWMSDAARRLFQNGRIDDGDFADVIALLKTEYGVTDPASRAPQPLTSDMIPKTGAPESSVTLVSLRNLIGVNAIASDQRIDFAPTGLTVVYGGNGAGKSGYSRVLRKACRARVTGGPILGNVFFSGARAVPSAEIEIRRAGSEKTETLSWSQNEPAPAELAAVAVFDSHCARAFTDAEGDVAYTPRGLDVLAGLASLCVRVRAQLESEIDTIKASEASFADLIGEHAAGHLLAQFGKKFATQAYRQDLKTVAAVSDAESAEIGQLTAQLAEINPAARAIEIRRLKARVEALAVQWEQCEAALSDEKANAAIKSGLALVEADVAAKLAAEAFAAQGEMLPGTGSEPWRHLLVAAREFSTHVAYPGHPFPHVDGAKCVLCQQHLDGSAAARLRQFELFIEQEAQKRANAARQSAATAFMAIGRVDPSSLVADKPLLDELEASKPGMRDRLFDTSGALTERKRSLLTAEEKRDFRSELAPIDAASADLRVLALQLGQNAEGLEQLAVAEARKKSEQRLADLRSRRALNERIDQVLQVADDLTLKKALLSAHRAADSGPVSRKMQALHAEALSADAEAAFARECAALGVAHVPIRSTTRMERGKAKQQVKLDTAGSERVGDVLSEGEQRALALATFMAEVSLVPGHGAVIFDDPMSSLDHARREKVARRLASEARVRQVIVFTHDLAFANHLADEAVRQSVAATAMSLRRHNERAGLIFPELPFAGQKVPERLEKIKAMAADADRAANAGDVEQSETIIRTAYGRLRETWERGVEESVLNETVVRFRPGVSTQRLRAVVVEDAHYEAIQAAMARCSHFAAHDTSSDANTSTPSTDELRADIEVARIFFATRRKLNDETDKRRREALERAAGFKQA
ncbi:AAA family ATPase [Burkholderia sola]|uniref:AAA family ATPase n=1 Tax=Burkholderia sola TaxID=2843302 RepID=UPI001C0A93A3|nr:DNA replication and repair protein RecF [Burkholderia cenocepacia]CAG2266742.1 DNA replication and repair protein RecF [Burkholderia cenocepacia]CAG2266922.1 DNA replication and repair protein RecF [Burkholderia cenocepacia]CAG2267114.1 DNA replication and repair protein RecF [Burkholderia cenocepacia]CAG2267156.1 DNA replication and repair protein RecF [Burkholderia cenocepacia]